VTAPTPPSADARTGGVWARRGLAAILGVAAIESVAAVVAARDPGEAAWPELAAALDARDDADPVFIAQDWLGPVARLHVPESAYLPSLTRADLHGVPRFHMLSWGDDGTAAIGRDLEGLPMPTRAASAEFGPLVWSTWESPEAGTVIENLTAAPHGLLVATASGTCRGRGSYRCAEGAVEPRIAEVDYRPRSCLGVAVSDGTMVKLTWPSARLGDVLRGHIGLSDYNARLRNDAPVRVVVRAGNVEVVRATITDRQGWWPFEVATTPGIDSVEIEITAGLSGTFGAKDYDGTPTRIPCVEVRTIARQSP
jgi:hypothetical protein